MPLDIQVSLSVVVGSMLLCAPCVLLYTFTGNSKLMPLGVVFWLTCAVASIYLIIRFVLCSVWGLG